jgi:chromatin remodeling complex protein RSC6
MSDLANTEKEELGGGIMSTDLSQQFESIMQTISNFKCQMTALQNSIRHLEKNVKREYRQVKKVAGQKKPKTKRAPSGFARPTNVTKELCEFMNKTEGTKIARTEVTKALVSYIKENNLSYSENNQIIIPDAKLKQLLGLKDDDSLTYFNMQKYMNKHFGVGEKEISNEA